MHVLYTTPLNLKGKMQDTLGVAPPIVIHKFLLISSISEKNKTKMNSKEVNCEYLGLRSLLYSNSICINT